ncbi:hypothetical protein HOLleu_15772 [Holothuria leucospilota]|uniref:Uncharacterized protein n=1 Tax=Holothuria leucospilota TaxID=206669 RepID=A0A9Q1HA60_HOLLE|nr:hypothetical protein HOLleu_15772 [Holothuria leucospilota]
MLRRATNIFLLVLYYQSCTSETSISGRVRKRDHILPMLYQCSLYSLPFIRKSVAM